mmetsp:Transcript_84449/g.131923  ORF Transcript_84449/g.131923 Transcript_84449/m.131923 type:complete len:598 (-) Transcript_84449:418-2211(-)
MQCTDSGKVEASTPSKVPGIVPKLALPKLDLQAIHSIDASRVESSDDTRLTPESWLQTYVDEYRQLPTPEHLTKFAQNRGAFLSYSEAKVVIRNTKLLGPDPSFLDALDNAILKLDHMPRPVPPPMASVRGIMGLLRDEGEHGHYEPMDLQALPSSSVLLNVYDSGAEDDLVEKINRWGAINESVIAGGVFHIAVQIYGLEWSFGATEIEGVPFSGIYSCLPRYNSHHNYKCTIDLGPTEMLEDEVSNLTQCMRCSNDWQGFTYDRVHHNCLHFANIFCNDLGVGNLPGWLDRFGRAAEQVEKLGAHWSHVKEMAQTNLQSAREQATPRIAQMKELAQTNLLSAREQVAKSAPTAAQVKEIAQHNLLSAREKVVKSAPEIGARVARWSSGFLKAAMQQIGDGANIVKEAFTIDDEEEAEREEYEEGDVWSYMWNGTPQQYVARFKGDHCFFKQQCFGAEGTLLRSGDWWEGDVKVGIMRLQHHADGLLSQSKKAADGEWGRPIIAQRKNQANTERIIVTFEPGPVGIDYLEGCNIVGVVEGGQAHRRGVKVGWKLSEIDHQRCESFEDKLFNDARNGNVPYQITFDFPKAENIEDTK